MRALAVADGGGAVASATRTLSQAQRPASSRAVCRRARSRRGAALLDGDTLCRACMAVALLAARSATDRSSELRSYPRAPASGEGDRCAAQRVLRWPVYWHWASRTRDGRYASRIKFPESVVKINHRSRGVHDDDECIMRRARTSVVSTEASAARVSLRPSR